MWNYTIFSSHICCFVLFSVLMHWSLENNAPAQGQLNWLLFLSRMIALYVWDRYVPGQLYLHPLRGLLWTLAVMSWFVSFPQSCISVPSYPIFFPVLYSALLPNLTFNFKDFVLCMCTCALTCVRTFTCIFEHVLNITHIWTVCSTDRPSKYMLNKYMNCENVLSPHHPVQALSRFVVN